MRKSSLLLGISGVAVVVTSALNCADHAGCTRGPQRIDPVPGCPAQIPKEWKKRGGGSDFSEGFAVSLNVTAKCA